jgi:hypothetical protein
VNQRLARGALAAIAPAILLSAVMVTGGAASAKGKKPPAATINCKDLTATVSWNPKLVPGAQTSKTTQITISGATVSGCTTSPASTVTEATSVTATASLSKNGNSCAQFSPSAPPAKGKTTYTFTIGWQGGGTSKIVFKGSSTSSSPPSFILSKGKATGSYVSKTAGATAVLTSASASAFAQCVAGEGTGVSSVNASSNISTGSEAVNV